MSPVCLQCVTLRGQFPRDRRTGTSQSLRPSHPRIPGAPAPCRCCAGPSPQGHRKDKPRLGPDRRASSGSGLEPPGSHGCPPTRPLHCGLCPQGRTRDTGPGMRAPAVTAAQGRSRHCPPHGAWRPARAWGRPLGPGLQPCSLLPPPLSPPLSKHNPQKTRKDHRAWRSWVFRAPAVLPPPRRTPGAPSAVDPSKVGRFGFGLFFFFFKPRTQADGWGGGAWPSRLALIRCCFPSYENATDLPLNSGRLRGSPQRLRASSQDPPTQKPKKPKKQKTPDSFPMRQVFRRDTAPLWPRGCCSVLEKAPEIKIAGGGPPGAGGRRPGCWTPACWEAARAPRRGAWGPRGAPSSETGDGWQVGTLPSWGQRTPRRPPGSRAEEGSGSAW